MSAFDVAVFLVGISLVIAAVVLAARFKIRSEDDDEDWWRENSHG